MTMNGQARLFVGLAFQAGGRRGALRRMLISFFATTGVLLAAGLGCAEELALSAGVTASTGLGEQSFSPNARLAVTAGPVRVAPTFDYSHKLGEAGHGWIAGLDLDVSHRWLVVGVDGRWRDGGPWTKKAVFARAGLRLGSPEIIYRHQIFSAAPHPSNHVRALELAWRQDIGAGFFLRVLIAGHMGRDYYGQRTRGVYNQIGLGRSWRRP